MKTIQQKEIYIPAFDYAYGRYSVRTEIQTWNTAEGEEPELVKTTIHRGVIETNPNIEDDGRLNAEGLTVRERNKRGIESQLNALAERVGLVAPTQSEKLLAAEKETCRQHLLKINQLEKVIAEQERIIAEMTAPEIVG